MRKERVLLAHGWLGDDYELSAIGDALEQAGFEVEHIEFDTLFGRFKAAADEVIKCVRAEPGPVHLIGFSFGGLVMRMAADACPDQVSSLLLIGTPNEGSPFADLLCLVFPTSAVRRLCCSAPPLPDAPPALPDAPPDLRIGFIAGTRGGFLGLFLKGPNDSRVTVDSAFAIPHAYEGMVYCKHEVAARSSDVLRHAVAFIRG